MSFSVFTEGPSNSIYIGVSTKMGSSLFRVGGLVDLLPFGD